jgi:hypothetical protein
MYEPMICLICSGVTVIPVIWKLDFNILLTSRFLGDKKGDTYQLQTLR